MIGPYCGLVLLDKPEGISSFQALAVVKRAAGTGKVGHTGTLDRFASGLLPALVGPATRLASLFLDLEKSYRATFCFGTATTTLDPEGEIAGRGEVPSLERIERILPEFTGFVEQVPPEYSAVHVEGRRAYALKREGRNPALKARTVHIRRIAIHRYDPPELELSIECGKGAYVRALARDMAEAMGTCAFVSRLCRTRVGGYRLEEAVRPEAFDARRDVRPPVRFLAEVPGLRCITIEDRFRKPVLNGEPFQEAWAGEAARAEGLFALFGRNGDLLALLERSSGAAGYRLVFSGG